MGLAKQDLRTMSDLLTLREVVHYLRVSKETVYRLVQSGRMPGVKVGGQWRFRKGDVDRFLTPENDEFSRARTTPGHGTRQALSTTGEALRVLLVEDDPEDAIIVQRRLQSGENAGQFEVTVASSLASAVAILRSVPVEIVLLDLNLPDSERFETLHTILVQAEGRPVVVLTGLDDNMLGLQAIERGAHDFLSKSEIEGSRLPKTLKFAAARARHNG